MDRGGCTLTADTNRPRAHRRLTWWINGDGSGVHKQGHGLAGVRGADDDVTESQH
jgi:hypothetical protein